MASDRHEGMEAPTLLSHGEGSADVKERSKARTFGNVLLSLLRRYHRYWCTKKAVKRCLPVLTWLPAYSRTDLRGDLIAGTTVALTLIPQSLAYAQLAALPPQYGLYSSFVGCFLYAILGSSKDLSIGPVAVLSLMTSEYVRIGGPSYAVLLTFLCGCVQLAMGLLNLGFFINFISAPVLSGFISAAAIIIATSQLKGLFGLKYKSTDYLDTMHKFFLNIHHTNYWDLLLGSSCIFLLLLLRRFKDSKFSSDSKVPLKTKKFLEGAWWAFATGRNAVMVLVSVGIACILISYGINAITLTQEVKAGLPPIAVPSFTLVYENSTNKTIHKSFAEVAADIGTGIVVIAFISVVEAVAIAKAFCKGKELNATQEIIAIGVCNVVGSFVSSYPISSSFSRSAINNTSGVRTPLGAVFTGFFVLLALGFLAPFFRYIPKPCLCAIVFSAVIFMVHHKDVLLIWKSNKIDIIPLFATFVCSFALGLEYGILIGASLSLIIYLYQQSRPNMNIHIETLKDGIICLYVRPDKNILYPTIEYAVSKITKHISSASDMTPVEVIVFNGASLTETDYTTALGIKYFIESFKKQNVLVIFTNLKKNILNTLKGLNLPHFHYCKIEEELESCISEKLLCSPDEEIQEKLAEADIQLNGVTPVDDRTEPVDGTNFHQKHNTRDTETNQRSESEPANESLLPRSDTLPV